MTIDTRKNKQGEITGYRLRCCVGRDEQGKQVWRTETIARPEGLTPAKEEKEVKRLAAEWEKKQKEEYKLTGTKTDDKSKITLEKFVTEIWLPVFIRDGSHKPTGVVFYEHMASIITGYFGSKKRLAQVDVASVKQFVKFLNLEARTQKGEPFSAETRVHAYGALRNILNCARRTKYIKENPCDDLTENERPHKEHRKVDFLTSEQATQFLECLRSESLFWQVYMNILLFCGLRRGEALALTWADVDGDKKLLKVSKNVTIAKDSTDGYAIGTPKSGKGRTVPISERLLAMLLKLKRDREEQLQVKLMPSTYIFCREAEPARPLYPTTPTRWMKRFVEKNNLPDVSPHDLRHTAATLMLASGAQLKDAQAIMGHADVGTMLRFYVGTSEQGQRNAINGTETLLAQGGHN